jgi:hypothetical protein
MPAQNEKNQDSDDDMDVPLLVLATRDRRAAAAAKRDAADAEVHQTETKKAATPPRRYVTPIPDANKPLLAASVRPGGCTRGRTDNSRCTVLADDGKHQTTGSTSALSNSVGSMMSLVTSTTAPPSLPPNVPGNEGLLLRRNNAVSL